MKFNSYAVYKPSGVEWLGDVLKHCEIDPHEYWLE